MAIDFEDEQAQKISLQICSQHNLKFDPEVTWGCVLCRSNRKKRVSGYFVVAVIFALAASVYLILPVIRPAKDPELSSVISVGDRSSDGDSEEPDLRITCLLNLSREVEKCIANVGGTGNQGRIDKEFCLNQLRQPNGNCDEQSVAQDYLKEPLYVVDAVPQWASIRSVFEQNQLEIEKCVENPNYDFSIRVGVNGRTGEAVDVTLSLFGLNPSQRFCLYTFMETLTFPVASADQYAFVTQLQSSALSLNRPKQVDTRKAEFQKFLDAQRSARLKEDRHAEIMRKREEVDKKFKAGMSESEQ